MNTITLSNVNKTLCKRFRTLHRQNGTLKRAETISMLPSAYSINKAQNCILRNCRLLFLITDYGQKNRNTKL
jgi:hypothetical protein